MTTLEKITNANSAQITKVSARTKALGCGNRTYLTVLDSDEMGFRS